MFARFRNKLWKHGANSCKLPWQMCFRTNKVCPDSLIVRSNISLLVPKKSRVEIGGREIAARILPAFRHSDYHVWFGGCLLWHYAPAILPSCFWSWKLWKGLRAQHVHPANAWCGVFEFMQTPQPPSGLRKKNAFWAQKGDARLSTAQVSGSGAIQTANKHISCLRSTWEPEA